MCPQKNIDRGSNVPLYQQIMDIIMEEYGDEISDYVRVPPEVELADRFQVSRMTVRQAVQALIQQGVCTRYRGRGTFLTPRSVHHSIRSDSLLSLFEDLSQSGSQLESEVVRQGLTIPPVHVRKRLGLHTLGDVLELVRLRRLHGRPLVYQISYFPAEFQGLIRNEDITQTSLLKVIESRLHSRPIEAHFTVKASGAEDSLAESLQLLTGDPILRIEKVSYLPDKQWFELAILCCVPDVFELSFITSQV